MLFRSFFSSSSSFSFSFFFLFILVRNIFTDRNSRISPVQLVFFPIRNKGCTCIGALTSTVYTGHIGWYGTELTSLLQPPTSRKPKTTSYGHFGWTSPSMINEHYRDSNHYINTSYSHLIIRQLNPQQQPP